MPSGMSFRTAVPAFRIFFLSSVSRCSEPGKSSMVVAVEVEWIGIAQGRGFVELGAVVAGGGMGGLMNASTGEEGG